jgi:ferrochelatase
MYQRIWTDKGSPLLIYTREQAAALQAALGETALVDFGMRYGNPPASSVLDRFAEKGVDRLLVFPMFPQYCAATTGSVYDAVFDHFKKRRKNSGATVRPAVSGAPRVHSRPGGQRAGVAREAAVEARQNPH